MLDMPVELVATLVGGVTGAMSWVKSLFKNAGKEIPARMKPYIVGSLAFFGSLAYFSAKNALSWENWLDVVMVTAMVTVLSILFHTAQKSGRSSDPRR